MIVRLKKRGEWPHPPNPSAIDLFRGCCIEVEPIETLFDEESPDGVNPTDYRIENGCNAPLFVVTDSRYLALRPNPPGCRRCVCTCYFVDDLQTFDSDFCDEEAQEGDLAFVQIPAVTR